MEVRGHAQEVKKKGRRVVMALDESEESLHALQWALNTLFLCPDLDTLILLHAKSPPTSSGAGPEFILSAEAIVSMEIYQDRAIEALMNRALELCKAKQVAAETQAVFGDPRDVICEVVEKSKADFLVIGSHGYGAIKRALLGSVSDYCAHHVKCPVVIVKKPHDHHKVH